MKNTIFVLLVFTVLYFALTTSFSFVRPSGDSTPPRGSSGSFSLKSAQGTYAVTDSGKVPVSGVYLARLGPLGGFYFGPHISAKGALIAVFFALLIVYSISYLVKRRTLDPTLLA